MNEYNKEKERDIKISKCEYEMLKKKTKALEIIKNKKVNVKWLLNSNSYEEYNKWYDIPLTQEEYDLLKEVLL